MAASGIDASGMIDSISIDKVKSDEGKEQSALYDTYGREFNIPDYTMNDILEAIPPECFHRSAVKGLSYVARDILLVILIATTAHYTIPLLPSATYRFLGWMLYAFTQGLVGTGIWVLAHECGHQAFSPSRTLNDTVGWILHSALLVPYFSWQISHGKHHKATGHLAKDMVFVPKERSYVVELHGANPEEFPEDGMNEDQENKFYDLIEETPIATLGLLIIQQTMGWFGYLGLNLSGQRYKDRKFWQVNHFNPSSPLFSKQDYNKILLSDLGIALMVGILYCASQKWGFTNVLSYYLMPYLWVNHWLVLITYLQHTDPALPHYRAEAWNFQRGAAATMDRDFGFIGQHLFHDIIETHVAHHYCSRIPFYNGREATKAIKKVMGDHYQFDDTNIFLAAWRSCRMCQYVSDKGQVVFYQNANGLNPAK